MVHILGVYIPDNKRVEIGLTQIYGIGRKRAIDICHSVEIPSYFRGKDLTRQHISQIFEILERDYKVESDLRKEKQGAIQRLMKISSYRGFRHRVGLPVRGQRTSTNAKTQRNLYRTRLGLRTK